jgi:hypothetical protein
MTEAERLEEVNRLRTALDELCLPYQSDDMNMPYDELIKLMPETEQAMVIHILGELEYLAPAPHISRASRTVTVGVDL